jgi:hypothetical protein
VPCGGRWFDRLVDGAVSCRHPWENCRRLNDADGCTEAVGIASYADGLCRRLGLGTPTYTLPTGLCRRRPSAKAIPTGFGPMPTATAAVGKGYPVAVSIDLDSGSGTGLEAM